MKYIFIILGLTFAGYFLFLIFIFLMQEKLLFPGTPLEQQHRFLNVPDLYEKKIEVEGATLSALHFQQADARGLIFFLHGNGGNLDSWVPDVDFYRQEKYDLFMLDYRGYGKSNGKIQSQQQVNKDVLTAWELISPSYKTKNLPIIIYGRSIGTYFATQLATQVESQLLVLVSPFTSMLAMARQKMPWVPTALLRYPLATDKIINQIRSPLVLLHGNEDKLITPDHAETLNNIASESTLVIIDDATHNDIHSFLQYKQVLADVLP